MQALNQHSKDLIVQMANEITLPPMIPVRQHFDKTHIDPAEIPAAAARELAHLRDRIRPGMEIAITAGSRGITNIAVILKAVVDFVKAAGAKPFLFPAMGTHGGATAEGQVEILAGYGITEAAMGCPIRATMDVVQAGITQEGLPVYCDAIAARADGILLCNRVKMHTDFRGPVESGLTKMAVIGMGKQKGAAQGHVNCCLDLPWLIPAMGKIVMDNTPVLGGLAIVENAYDETYLLKALTREEIPTQEPKLLEIAKANFARILLPEADVLVVDRAGKNISGNCMDNNVTGAFASPGPTSNFHTKRIAVLDLTDESHGSFVGLGMADLITQRVFEKLDPNATYMNLITSSGLNGARVPVYVPGDKTCIQIAVRSALRSDRKHSRIIRIRDTAHLDTIHISPALLDEARANPNLEILGEAEEWVFNDQGDLW